MVWLAALYLYFLLIRFCSVLVNFLGRQWLRSGRLTGSPFVSVLIPARNEEHTIGKLLESLGGQRYENLEILVYDDLSTDQTAQVVRRYAEKDARIRLLTGKELPEGWLGKNHACHCLAQDAGGDYLLFLDADVFVGQNLIHDTLAQVRHRSLALLSLFPVQIMLSGGEKLVVPIMNWTLLTLLPLFLIRRCRWTSFSAANGQFMLFDGPIYRKNQWHRVVKAEKVEDIVLVRRIKRRRYKAQTLLSNGGVKCRMYTSYAESVKGFSKNIRQFFGNSRAFIITYVALTTFGPAVVFLRFGIVVGGGTFLLLAVMWWMVSRMSRQNFFINLLLAIPRHFAFLHILHHSGRAARRSHYEWKGRKIV